MIPNLHGAGEKAAVLVKPQCRNVTGLCNDTHTGGPVVAEPAQRLTDQLLAQATPLVIRMDRHQAKLTFACLGQMTSDISRHSEICFGYENRVCVSMAALLNPGFIKTVTGDPREMRVEIESRFVMAGSRDFTERGNIRFAPRADAFAFQPFVPISDHPGGIRRTVLNVCVKSRSTGCAGTSSKSDIW